MSYSAGNFFSKLGFLRDGLEPADDAPGKTASNFFEVLSGKGDYAALPQVFQTAVRIIHEEYEAALVSERGEAFRSLESVLDDAGTGDLERAEALWKAVFPEAMHLDPDPDVQIERLRQRRIVDIIEPCRTPVSDPASQIIFTSNVLLSPPLPDNGGIGTASDSEIARIVGSAAAAGREEQLYWYDHPIPVGAPVESDEAVYGLRGLSQALAYEKMRGGTDPDSRMNVLLSVSVTHRGLHRWARPWLKAQLARAEEGSLDGLDVFAFTEDDAASVIDIIAPWIEDISADDIKKCFGVDGEYGRHYSFLKAMPALWGLISTDSKRRAADGIPKIATFKIDLDQVFPQEELVAETGKSALEQFLTPLWGAKARDEDGRDLELGMIAGGLVNEKDISAGLFTPDIPWPTGLPAGEDLLFFKQRPMAVSTRAELMTRYGTPGAPDGVGKALQRIHVTGGTNGIRFDALRKFRPFTPSFVGRAEDQAYILSVLAGNEEGRALRYIHASGLMMRHDKEAFATEAVKAGKAGSFVGDLVRLFVFSRYAALLPGSGKEVKRIVDPFTGCFITPMPATLAFLRLALRLYSAEGGSLEERRELLELAAGRLDSWVSNPAGKALELKSRYQKEKRAWKGYYDALDRLESDLKNGTSRARDAALGFMAILEDCRVSG